MQERLYFFSCYLSTYAEEGNGGVWWVKGRWGGFWWDFPPHDTTAFSACVNKASLNCLIILCKLRDQGTYWKPPSSAQCRVRLWPTSSEASPLPTHALIPSWNEPQSVPMKSTIKWLPLLSGYHFSERYISIERLLKYSLFITKEWSLYLLVA